jgi:hypothetical protein
LAEKPNSCADSERKTVRKGEGHMKVTLLDDQGAELTEITSHLGRSAGRMLVDRAVRPDALFQYYFGGRRTVGVVTSEEQYSASLGTRWQMGGRFWFLHEFSHIPSVPYNARTHSAQDSGLVAAILHASPISADPGAPIAPPARGALE